jgi:hypothetical protein
MDDTLPFFELIRSYFEAGRLTFEFSLETFGGCATDHSQLHDTQCCRTWLQALAAIGYPMLEDQ